jgi:hypothetical protein
MLGNALGKQPLPLMQRFVRSLSRWIPLGFIAVIVVLLSFGVADLRALAANSPAETTLTAAQLKDKIDELRWILELILAAAGLFTIAQGIASGYSASSFSEQAERLIASAKERLATFTMLEARMKDAAANRDNLEHSLASNSPIHDADEGFNWRRRLYEEIPLQTRQQILSTEKFYPYVLSGETDQRPVYERMLRYFAQFYWSKFVYERKFGLGQIEDLERAEFHLDLAIRKTGRSFFLLNDMGNIQIEYYKALSLSGRSGPEYETLLRQFKDRAALYFRDSIAVHKEQLRAYYNLAYIEAEFVRDSVRGSLEDAVKHLREGLKYAAWERKPVPEYTCNAQYNLACYSGRLLAPSLVAEIQEQKREKSVQATRAQCLKALQEAAKIGMISPTQVDEDFNMDSVDKKGDLYWFARPDLSADPDFHAHLQEFDPLRRDLSKSYVA